MDNLSILIRTVYVCFSSIDYLDSLVNNNFKFKPWKTKSVGSALCQFYIQNKFICSIPCANTRG